jgi:predicted dehydrogenase
MIRVALIGYGYAGRTFHAPLIRATPGLELAVVSSQAPDRVRGDLPGVAVVPSPADAWAIPSIDLVVIATPNDTHVPIATAALGAGKHVVIEKPIAPMLAEARGLASLARRLNLVLAVFQNRRWDGDFLALEDLIARAALGDVTHFESHFDRYRPQVRARWREQHGAGSGVWYDLGPHLVDQTLQLFGLPTRVLASLAMQRPGAQADDWAHVILEYGRRRVVLHASMLVAGRLPRFVVHGQSGTWIKYGVDAQERQLIARLQPGGGDGGGGGNGERERAFIVDGATGSEEEIPIPRGDYGLFYSQVRDALQGAGSNPVPPAQAIAVAAVIETAIRSAAEGRALTLPLTDAEVRDFSG